MKNLQIPSGSQSLGARYYEAKSPGEQLILIASATGVSQGYYKSFAEFLTENGCSVLTFDYEGIGESKNGSAKNHDIDVVGWGQQNLEDDHLAPKAAVDWLSAQYSSANPKRIHLVPSDFNTSKIGHFGIFNKRFKDSIWKLLLSEIKG